MLFDESWTCFSYSCFNKHLNDVARSPTPPVGGGNSEGSGLLLSVFSFTKRIRLKAGQKNINRPTVGIEIARILFAKGDLNATFTIAVWPYPCYIRRFQCNRVVSALCFGLGRFGLISWLGRFGWKSESFPPLVSLALVVLAYFKKHNSLACETWINLYLPHPSPL